MLFQDEHEALAWYNGKERVLTRDFLNTIPWGEVKNHTLDPKFFPVLLYMRDVEKFTEVYYNELNRTPTGKDPVIRAFMDRWSVEETLHADLLNRFLAEAGYPTEDCWYEKAKAKIPLSYRVSTRITTLLTNCIGKKFSAVHMTWGAINELSTLTGYQRLWSLARHPVLEHILKGIAREEARHSLFYWSIARIKLMRSTFAQELSRFIVKHFWTPVGQGTKPAHETNLVIKTLFRDALEPMRTQVNNRIAELPGFQAFTTVINRVTRAAL